ncbi:putative HxlR family transcriptional regulator [Gordonia rhizosphera NBRC 16068]|uniref:Putative HxlR family transcriptional regulator n=2 Tax=Gordonia rhizosphera TaxID=83341 RepID=K6V143_9ACTN|nr:putative HxlR family transcriptional regulator [Gordonia rhizosphera NBRC 16068]
MTQRVMRSVVMLTRLGFLRRISPKTLTDRLRQLEGRGVVTRTMYAEIPPRVEYDLTPKGQALRPVIDALAEWSGGSGTAELTPRGVGASLRRI